MCGLADARPSRSAVAKIRLRRVATLSHESGQEFVYAASRLAMGSEGATPADFLGAAGIRHIMVVPLPAADSIVTVPPCSSIRLLTSDRPSPAPDRGVPGSNFLGAWV